MLLRHRLHLISVLGLECFAVIAILLLWFWFNRLLAGRPRNMTELLLGRCCRLLAVSGFRLFIFATHPLFQQLQRALGLLHLSGAVLSLIWLALGARLLYLLRLELLLWLWLSLVILDCVQGGGLVVVGELWAHVEACADLGLETGLVLLWGRLAEVTTLLLGVVVILGPWSCSLVMWIARRRRWIQLLELLLHLIAEILRRQSLLVAHHLLLRTLIQIRAGSCLLLHILGNYWVLAVAEFLRLSVWVESPGWADDRHVFLVRVLLGVGRLLLGTTVVWAVSDEFLCGALQGVTRCGDRVGAASISGRLLPFLGSVHRHYLLNFFTVNN